MKQIVVALSHASVQGLEELKSTRTYSICYKILIGLCWIHIVSKLGNELSNEIQ